MNKKEFVSAGIVAAAAVGTTHILNKIFKTQKTLNQTTGVAVSYLVYKMLQKENKIPVVAGINLNSKSK